MMKARFRHRESNCARSARFNCFFGKCSSAGSQTVEQLVRVAIDVASKVRVCIRVKMNKVLPKGLENPTSHGSCDGSRMDGEEHSSKPHFRVGVGHPGSKNVVREVDRTFVNLDHTTHSVVWILVSVSAIASGIGELTVIAYHVQLLSSLYRC
jgi:hypothetical protein